MDFIKTKFSITDLENLSGVKKHTIRIWEKRYQLLTPERSDSNIRYYSTASLVHLLNIVLLYNQGFKISKIAKMSPSEMLKHCRKLVAQDAIENKMLNELKLAMLHFDQASFQNIYQELSKEKTFSEIFKEYFIPLLTEIGFLWQTDTINPAHEHFITSLIKQKMYVEIEQLDLLPTKKKRKRFVLFLPDNEIHDIGITFLHYEILNHGYPSIYLGPSVPLNCLDTFSEGKTIFVAYFTTKPDAHKVQDYIDQFNHEVLKNTKSEFWVLGLQIDKINELKLSKNVKKFDSIQQVISQLN